MTRRRPGRNAFLPNELAVVRVLTEDVAGAQKWNPLRRKYEGVPTAEYEQVEEAMAAVLERVALAVDWNRLLAEASWRHGLVHDVADEETAHKKNLRWKCPASPLVCGNCMFHGQSRDRRAAMAARARRARDEERAGLGAGRRRQPRLPHHLVLLLSRRRAKELVVDLVPAAAEAQ